MKRKGFTSLILASLLSLACAGKTNADSQPANDPTASEAAMHQEVAYNDTTVQGFHLQWRTDTAGLLHVKIEAKTTGWVAVGFAPSMMMKDANIIMGYVKGDTAYLSDQFGAEATAHKPDVSLGGTDDVKDKSGTEKDGKTMIHFVIPLDSKDKFDKVLEKGKTYKLILAHGPDGADNFTNVHAAKTSVKITL